MTPLQQLRHEGHKAFDRLWTSGFMSRNEAYRKLAQCMGLPEEEAHFARFNEEQCRKAIAWFKTLEIPTRRERRRLRETSTKVNRSHRLNRSKFLESDRLEHHREEAKPYGHFA